MELFENQEFENKGFSNDGVGLGEYDDCSFVNSSCSKADFSNFILSLAILSDLI
jgi:hypothetical protein